MTKEARTYTAKYLRHVHGWLAREAAEAIIALASAQDANGIRGGAAEIGVHEGRLFILLSLLLHDGDRSLAIDLFDSGQRQNVDDSGYGTKERFEKNTRRYIPRRDICLIETNSMNVTASDVTSRIGQTRLFSVDGGHTAEIAYHDLCVATGSSCPGGLVIVDDYLSAEWPGVTEGVAQFMLERRVDICPVAFVRNKLLLAIGDGSIYGGIIKGAVATLFGKPCPVVLRSAVKHRLAGSASWRRVRSTAVGRLIRRFSQ